LEYFRPRKSLRRTPGCSEGSIGISKESERVGRIVFPVDGRIPGGGANGRRALRVGVSIRRAASCIEFVSRRVACELERTYFTRFTAAEPPT
jgi:hypothetical protein